MVDRVRGFQRGACASLGDRILPIFVEVNRHIWAKFYGVARVDLPLHAYAGIHVVTIGFRHRFRVGESNIVGVGCRGGTLALIVAR